MFEPLLLPPPGGSTTELFKVVARTLDTLPFDGTLSDCEVFPTCSGGVGTTVVSNVALARLLVTWLSADDVAMLKASGGVLSEGRVSSVGIMG